MPDCIHGVSHLVECEACRALRQAALTPTASQPKAKKMDPSEVRDAASFKRYWAQVLASKKAERGE